MSPPTLITDRYNYSRLETQFVDLIRPQAGGEEIALRITSSNFADLDNDGTSDDLFGTALLQLGSGVKSIIYLMREDGATRFLEASGEPLRPTEGFVSPLCFESHSWLCRNPLERAARQIHSPRLSLLEFDSTRAGLEIVINLPQGRLAVLNSLEVFTNP